MFYDDDDDDDDDLVSEPGQPIAVLILIQNVV